MPDSSSLSRTAVSAVLLVECEEQRVARYCERFAVLLGTERDGEVVITDCGTGAPIDLLPQDLTAIVVPEDRDLPSTLVARLQRLAAENSIDVPLVRDHPGTEDILEHCAGRVRSIAQRATQLSSRLATLRKLHEDLQNSYTGLRSFIYNRNLAAPEPTFISAPDLDHSGSAQHFTEVVQVLPVELRNVCGFSVHVEEPPPAFAEGELQIRLFAPDDDEFGIDWRVPFNRVTAGWLTFVFEQSSSYLRRSAALWLSTRDASGFTPRLSFGIPTLRPDKAAMLDGQRTQRPLALKVWTAPPGAPLNITSQIWPAFISGQTAVSRIELTIDEQLRIEEVTDTSARFSFPTVKVFSGERRILVHPFGSDATIARLPGACPPRARQVVAEVITRHEQAGPVEYGLASSAAGEEVTGTALEEMVAGVEWLTLPNSSRGRLALDIPAGDYERRDLYLLTRLPPGGSRDFCWASFVRIYFSGNFR